ncbi:helicase-exonuclease AddAB subunit AddA [Lachnospiraceae bacterium 62-35]
MGMRWTEKQEQVIVSRNRNLLVSAAAGSGKTAVLVERIIRMITDPDKPLDIDRLLVMTFTNAAAAEMRERIGAAIEQRLKEDGKNRHLQMQATLVQQAQITTIHSFCLNIIRNHFNKLDIDPAFRIGDEGELLLMKADVMKDMLEDFYQEGRQEFYDFVEIYSSGRGDFGIEGFIMQVYEFSCSSPWPEQWFEICRTELIDGQMDHMEKSPWMKFLLHDISLQLEETEQQMREAARICGEEDGPQPYLPVILEDMRTIEKLKGAENYKELAKLMEQVSFGRLAAVRSKDVDGDKKAYVSNCRSRMKKAVEKIAALYFPDTEENMEKAMKGCAPGLLMLLELAEEFSKRFKEKKKEKNIVDFNDLEHFALEVLTDEREGEDGKTLRIPSLEADELSAQYEEILVDEYQDSNLVQETLIRCISRERKGQPNVFMVGDVKQSIYSFRLAKPDLFLEKYNTYPSEEGLYQKIELHQNFRSRASVLSSVNEVFFQIMTKALGNVEYTEETSLHPGAVFPEYLPEEKGKSEIPYLHTAEKTELLLVNTDTELLKELDEEHLDYTSREMEARMIAGRIKELVDREHGLAVWDREKEEYRPVQYRDMVVLLRSVTGWAEIFLEVFMNEGIPAYAESDTGYFTASEVEIILALLSVIDNPMQDIPLAAVLKSPIGGLTDRDLAHLSALYKKNPSKGQERGLYGAWKNYEDLEREGKLDRENETELTEKLEKFSKLLQGFRKQSIYLPVHELIYEIYRQTGYYDYVSAMPAGKTRKANLDMLAEKAVAYGKTSYKGLFHFVRYIENLKKYNTDFGEASILGENDNTIRIMSIHKSKGLEFPVVFLAGMGKRFNKTDVYGKILIDSDLGIGSDWIDTELRVKAATLKKNALRRKMEIDAMGEELRVLYVAMTRAKELLIMSASDRGLENRLKKWEQIPSIEGRIPFTVLSLAGSYLDWILMSRKEQGMIDVYEVPVGSILGREMAVQTAKAGYRESLLSFDTEKVYDLEYRKELEEAFSYQYPYKSDIALYAKMTVSELKQQGQMIDEEESQWIPTVPAFMDEAEKEEGGACRGTAYHRVLELLDFQEISSLKEASKALHRLLEDNRLTMSNYSLVRPDTVWRFLDSPLGRRMKKAAVEGRLHKEQQFVIGIPAGEMGMGDSEELILVQGIMDAYMEEESKEGEKELVLIDYKTDYLKKGEEKLLVDRYGVQLAYYKRALEQMTGQHVKDTIIYSLTLQEEIHVYHED